MTSILLPSKAKSSVSLDLRRRSDDHPLAMFATLVAVALGSMAFTSSTGHVVVEPQKTVGSEFPADAKASRLPLVAKAKAGCEGVAWGVETPACLREIAEASGQTKQVRIIAAAEVDRQRPNVF